MAEDNVEENTITATVDEVMNIEAPRRHYLFDRLDAAIASFTSVASR